MNDLLLYLLKVSAGLAIISLPYFLLIRNDPNLVLKRFYLLAGVIATWIFPLITFRKPDLLVNFTPTVFIDPAADQLPFFGPAGSMSGHGIAVNWVQGLIAIYLSGMVFILLKNLYLVIKWNLVWHRTKTEEGLALTESDQVFTLFTRIFIPRDLQDNPDLDHILLHEKAHVRQLHFIDLTVMELTLLITWFNPFSWLISRMIKENHEHLADRHVLSAGINPARYRAQLLNHTLGVNVLRLGNQFNHSLTFKRFKMMKKPTRSPWGTMKIAMLIPAALVAMALTTGMAPQQKMIKGKVVLAESNEPAPGAAIIISGTTTGTVSDINGEFSLTVDGDPDIVISFVGYATLRVKASKINNKTLKLEATTYTLDLDQVSDSESSSTGGSISFKAADGSEGSPVFVLDGQVVTQIDNLDPGTIEKVEVFKDPANDMVKKYNAKDGVIIITTKEEKVMLSPKEAVKASSGSNEPNRHGDEVFYIVEEMPSFPGGNVALKNYIYSNLEYPDEAREKGIKGEVQVQFTVKASGKLDDIKVIRSVNPGLNESAMKVIKNMPDWKPGSQRGKPVSVNVVIPVRFGTDKG